MLKLAERAGHMCSRIAHSVGRAGVSMNWCCSILPMTSSASGDVAINPKDQFTALITDTGYNRDARNPRVHCADAAECAPCAIERHIRICTCAGVQQLFVFNSARRSRAPKTRDTLG